MPHPYESSIKLLRFDHTYLYWCQALNVATLLPLQSRCAHNLGHRNQSSCRKPDAKEEEGCGKKALALWPLAPIGALHVKIHTCQPIDPSVPMVACRLE